MSVGDWVAIAVFTVITIVGWVTLVSVWRHRTDIGWFRGVRPGTPQSAGHHAAMGAVVAFCTLATIVVWGLAMDDALGDSEKVTWVLWWVLVAGFALWPLAAVLYFFLRPRLLVPPHLRDSRSGANDWLAGRKQRRSGPRPASDGEHRAGRG